MFCTQCGNAVEQQARFCSKCGKDLTPALVNQQSKRDMSVHINILGWLLVGSAILTGIGGLAAMLVGRLIEARHIPLPPDVPFAVMHFAGGITTIIWFAVLAGSCGIAAAGVGLPQYRSWGRGAAVVVSAPVIFPFLPVWVGIGLYGFLGLFLQG